MMSKADLPEDVEMDILLRLPVKSLLRFRCVCKPWCTTFQSPVFITNHYLKQNSLHNSNNNTNTSVLVHSCDYDLRPEQEFPYFSVMDETLTIKENIQLPFPKNDFARFPIIMGPCNGLICFWDRCDKIVLWNPATREFKQLPVSDVERPPCAEPPFFFTIGFGFDSKTDDYKVILIVYNFYNDSESHRNHIQVDLYTLSTDSWREISGVGYQHCSHPQFNSFINGVYHWARNEDIVTFDMADEVFSTLSLPFKSSDFICEPSLLNESLAVIYYPLQSYGNCFDVWVMKEYGVKESWIKQLTIGPIFETAMPLGFWNNGGLFLECDKDQKWQMYNELVLYNPNTQDIEKLQVHSISSSMRVVIYVESLVPINGRREYEDELFIRLPTQMEDA